MPQTGSRRREYNASIPEEGGGGERQKSGELSRSLYHSSGTRLLVVFHSMTAMTWVSWLLLAVILAVFLVTFLVLRYGCSEACISFYFIAAAVFMLAIAFIVIFVLLILKIAYRRSDTGWTPLPRPWART